jgi:hypothetical protein
MLFLWAKRTLGDGVINSLSSTTLPSLTQQHKLPREKVSLLLLRFQAIILLIKINKNWFLKEERISFQKLIFYKF